VVLAVAHYGSVFVMPSITIVNNSGRITEQMKVTLPSSNLNFGALMNGEHNTLHYTLNKKMVFTATNLNMKIQLYISAAVVMRQIMKFTKES
jgi:hypothetical protein